MYVLTLLIPIYLSKSIGTITEVFLEKQQIIRCLKILEKEIEAIMSQDILGLDQVEAPEHMEKEEATEDEAVLIMACVAGT